MDKITRQTLQQLASVRLREAKVLLDNDHPSGAYHLVGIAIECALKACIAKQIVEHEFPDLKKVQEYWKHELDKLVKAAGLEQSLLERAKSDLEFRDNWLTVKDWKVDSRYEEKPERTAADIYEAATNSVHGVLMWIKENW